MCHRTSEGNTCLISTENYNKYEGTPAARKALDLNRLTWVHNPKVIKYGKRCINDRFLYSGKSRLF